MFGIILLMCFVAFVVWYALRGRAWLKTKTWAQPFFDFVEPIEIALYRKSETVLMGRLLSVGGFVVTAYDFVAALAPSLDLTPITARLLEPVPADMRGLVLSSFSTAIGLLIVWLRKRTSKPLEVVAAPESDPATVMANARVEAANAQAVATVEAAKA